MNEDKVNEDIKKNSSSNGTRDHLLKVGADYFAEFGYEGASIRMIAKAAGVNSATIHFHFNTKEEFFYAVLVKMADYVFNFAYHPIWTKIEKIRKHGDISSEMAWKLIEEYIDIELATVWDTHYPQLIYLLVFEQMVCPCGKTPLADMLFQKCEGILKELLMDYWQSRDEEFASVISRTVNGAIVTHGEHPYAIRSILHLSRNEKLSEQVRVQIRNFVLAGIKNIKRY